MRVNIWDPFPGPTRFGGSEPSPGCPVVTQSLKIISLHKRFQNLGKPINIYIYQNTFAMKAFKPFQNDLQE